MPGFELIGIEEKQAVMDIFDSQGGVMFAHGFDGLRNGNFKVREFENMFAKHIKSGYAQAVTSGSSALKVALKAAGVKPGDEVITQSFTFIATVEAIIECGATPIIVDIDDTLNMDPNKLESVISDNTKAIIPVHMMGCAADMDQVNDIAKKHNLIVIEDAAWGCGGYYKGQHLGTIGDYGCFSFDAGKVITCGEGGMVVSNSEQKYIAARAYHDHGHEYSTEQGRAEEAALCPGFNYRMTELQAAVMIKQLEKLAVIVDSQKKNKASLKGFLDLPFEFQRILDLDGDNANSLIFYCDSKEQASQFVKEMQSEGLGTKNLPDAIKWHFAQHWGHLFLDHPYYKDVTNQWQSSERQLSRAIALPIMVKSTEEDLKMMADKINSIAKRV